MARPSDMARARQSAKLKAAKEKLAQERDQAARTPKPANPFPLQEGGPGRPPGLLNRYTLEKQAKLQKALEKEFAKLTPAEFDALLPLEIMRKLCLGALKAKDYTYAASLVKDWAPYEHAKKAPEIIPAEAGSKETFKIEGGIPTGAALDRAREEWAAARKGEVKPPLAH